MPEPTQDGGAPAVPKVEDLVKQVDNLNKAVAGYRDEARTATEKAKSTEAEFTKYKNEVEPKLKKIENLGKDDDKEPVQLSKDDQSRLEKWAEEKGFVKKEEFEAEKLRLANETIMNAQNQAVSEFLQNYPKYDAEDEWKKVLGEFQLYKTPTTVDGFRKLLTKIHKDLSGGKTEEDGAVKAKIQDVTRSRLGLGRGNQVGFEATAETAESLQARYPNLSREQIDARLKDLKTLYPKKDK